MAVQPASDWPLSAQLAQHLRELIRSGQLAAGDRVPSEIDLAREHDASRDTAQRALAFLADEGLIVRRREKPLTRGGGCRCWPWLRRAGPRSCTPRTSSS